ncbi:hypothetical protein HELRODRAFT_193883 [Helobdella robusta]|uniref:Uncharacterized protein n=1 Tax=Helobdella robusta TaxID=6412 RepID=T1FVF9_HELRO|nr:hypothetical protein HELRODRAFT_193883 [Helobdella robusta]ESN93825.1 hypothetical protein HELRODRAFT_193883 [Helobdella robusta]
MHQNKGYKRYNSFRGNNRYKRAIGRLRHDINQLQLQQQQQQQQISKSAHGSFDPLYDYSSTSIQQQQHLTDERKYPLLQSTDGGRLATYYPTIPTPTDNLNEYATMRLLQNEQLIANPNRARKYNQDGVFPGEPAGMMVVANQTGAPCGNYRYPPRTMVSTFLTTSDVPYTFGKNISQDGTNYKNDHIYESPDIVKKEVDKLVQKSSFQVPPPPPSQASSALKTRPQFPVGVHDVAKRNDDVSCGVGAFRSSARKMEHQTSLVSNDNEGGVVGD